jgi:hypothetical protein
MSLLVLVILSLAGFLSIESRVAASHQAAVQGRLAALASLRLALGHLQAEAGPDRRVTARADLTADTTQPGWTWQTIRNPLWTGVWRTDRPEQPPAWLVSGRHDRPAGSQSVSLSGASDYLADQWLPWQSDYALTTSATLIPLVGDGSATPHELATATDPGRPDGRISLPRVSSPDPGGFGYAYWVGDEGVKARINLHDRRHDSGTDEAEARGMLTSSGRAGVDVLEGFEALSPNALLTRLLTPADLGMPELAAEGYSDAAPSGLPAASLRHRRHRHDLSFASQGLATDSFWGGLKVDLSLAFELSDAEFMASEFGEGPGGATLHFWQMNRTTRANPPVMEFTRGQKIWMPIWVPQNLSDTATAPYRYDVAALYTHNWHDPDDSTRGYIALRGPTWLLLRDFHRLYKQVEWPGAAAPRLRARTFWPNVVQNERMQPGTGGTYHYSHIYNRMDIPNNGTVRSDPFVNDLNGGAFSSSTYSLSPAAAANGSLGSGSPGIKPVRVAATPYISRVAVVFGIQQSGGVLRLVCTPVVVMHNPFNVAMALRQSSPGDSAAARLSFRWWNSWVFDFNTPAEGSWSRTMLELAQASDASASSSESLRTYIPETTLNPGEFRIFTPPASQPIPFARVAATENTYDFNGGFWLPLTTPGGGPLAAGAQSMTAGLRPQGQFYIRHLMTSWPGDSISEPNTGWDGIYNRCSEHTELFDSQIQANRNGNPPPRTFPAGFVFPGPGAPPQILAVIDYSIRWPRDPLPFPILTHSNPLALMTRGDANGFPPSNPSFGTGFATSSPSYRLTLRTPNTWGEAFETGDGAGTMAMGGLSSLSGQGGQTAAVLTGVPLRPPQSLAEYVHANLNMRDQDPLYTIGAGFASPNLPLDKIVHYRSAENWTDADRVYLANLAIWDRYFLSSAAPERTQAVAYAETRSLTRVLDDFLDGAAGLANPRMELWRGRSRSDPAVRAEVREHDKIAGHLVINGAFNVNSTSVDAWAAVLASNKGVPNGADRSAATRFPRTERADNPPGPDADSRLDSAASWSGWSALSDAQIRTLARCIVDEIRFRTQLAVRTPLDRQINKSTDLAQERRYRGVTAGGAKVNVPTPFLGLSQFVNRFLDVTPSLPAGGGATNLAQARAGCLQAAIARAETEGARISNRVDPAPGLSAASLAGNQGPGQQSWTSNPDAIENWDAGTRSAGLARKTGRNQSHAALFAPGSLLQQDILAAIGPQLSARSDTFVIRAYGDTREPGGEVRGKAWIEAVVQRTPDHCVPADAPSADPAAMRAINLHLGRKLRVVSARWLRPEEI